MEPASAPFDSGGDSPSSSRLHSDMEESSLPSDRLKNQPLASFKDDILLIRTSQEVFGRKIGTPKEKKVSLRAHSSSESKRQPLPMPSHSSSLNTATGRRLQQTVDGTLRNQSFLEKFADDMKETHEIERVFQQKLRALSSQRRRLEKSYHKETQYLAMILQMPNVIRTLLMVSESMNRSRRLNGFRRWKLIVARVKFIEAQRLRIQRRIMSRTHRLWLESVAYHRLLQRRQRLLLQQQLRLDSAVRIIQRLFLFFRRNQEQCRQNHLKREREQKLKYETKEIKKIQRVYRGWRGRCLYCDKWRLFLLLEMRQWSNGNIQKLLDRSSTAQSPDFLVLPHLFDLICRSTRPSCVPGLAQGDCDLLPSVSPFAIPPTGSCHQTITPGLIPSLPPSLPFCSSTWSPP
jgi:hypothetical protein